jgi:hypothetical protein
MTDKPSWQAIPTKLSKAQFEEFVLPHLSRGRRGPPPTLSLQRVRRRHWLPPPPQRTGQATFTADGSGTAKVSATDTGLASRRKPFANGISFVHSVAGNPGAELQRGSLSQASRFRTSDTGLRQPHLAEVCTLSGQGKIRTPMQAITACHSLSPRSLTRSTNSSPCGLPAVSQCSARLAVSRAYHVPIFADPMFWVYPVSACLSPGSPLDDVSISCR